jgi:UDP-N-acetylmuramoyl-L-alanyl-D-glutamate--2,6-diaminopimelate ligase
MIKLPQKIINHSIYNNIQSDILIEDISWKAQESHSDHVLFYKFNDNSMQSVSQFKDRIKNSSYSLLITNFFDKQMSSIKNLLVVADSYWLEAQKILLDELYPLPDEIKLVGITGTNGKTTTVDILSQIATLHHISNISIGTLGLRKNGKKLEDFGLTTPSFIDLRKFLHQYGNDNKLFLVEASSHALVQQRFYGLHFDASAWTSFSQDHLDFHETMEQYFEAKKLIINMTKSKKVHVSSRSEDLIKRLVDIQIVPKFNQTATNSFFKAKHNLINLEVALGVLNSLNLIKDTVNNEIISQIKPPPGRFDIIEYKNNFIIIDFAHTPDALKNICQSIKESFSGYELITLFGCGGDRDKSKRALMGEVAQKNSDRVIVTSDNPRFESPEKIIDDILDGMIDERVVVITERRAAIEHGIKELNKSVLLIAGKGHEDYMDICGLKTPYSDEQTVREFTSDE